MTECTLLLLFMILFDLAIEPESGCDDTILRAVYFQFHGTKGKVFPLQARCGPEGG